MEKIRKVFDAFKDSEEKSVSINLGMRDIKNEELTRYIYDFLSTALHPEHFIFEILENEDVDEYDRRFESARYEPVTEENIERMERSRVDRTMGTAPVPISTMNG